MQFQSCIRDSGQKQLNVMPQWSEHLTSEPEIPSSNRGQGFLISLYLFTAELPKRPTIQTLFGMKTTRGSHSLLAMSSMFEYGLTSNLLLLAGRL